MAVAVAEVRRFGEELRSLVARFEPGEVSAGDAAVLVGLFAAMKNSVATAEMLSARRVADTSLWRGSGDRSAAHWLARTTGSTVHDAVTALDTARRLDDLPVAAEAARSGSLSRPQVAAVADAAAVAPRSERDLVGFAGKASMRELRDECLGRKAAAAPDDEARHQRVHRARSFRHHTDAEGAVVLHARLTADAGAIVLSALRPFRDRVFEQARRDGLRETSEAYDADALVAMARAAVADGCAHGGEPSTRWQGAKVIVRVDHTALARGGTVEGEVSEIAGVGPVPVSVVREMIEHDAFVAAVVTKGVDVVNVAHLGRQVTAHQRTAIEHRDPGCAVLGCPAGQRLEIDHRVPWATTRQTRVDELDALCHHHHQLKTHHGYRLAPGTGKRLLLAPHQPGAAPGPSP